MVTEEEFIVGQAIYESLMRLDSFTGKPIPAAAKKVEISEGGRKLRFHLRKDALWSDGTPLDAKDFVEAWNRLLNPISPSWASEFLRSIRGVKSHLEGGYEDPSKLGFRAVSEKILEIALDRPDSNLLRFLAHPVMAPVQRQNLEKFGKQWWHPSRWVGNGAFRPKSKTPMFMVLGKNPTYSGHAQSSLEEVYYYFVETASEGLKLFYENSVDQFGYRDFASPMNALGKFVGHGLLISQDDLRTMFVRVNSNRSSLSNLEFRRSLAMVMDREILSRSFLAVDLPLASSLIPKGVRNYEPPKGYLRDVNGARKGLRDLGFCQKSSPSGCKSMPRLSLIYRDSPEFRKLALALSEVWKREINFKSLTIEGLSSKEFQEQVQTEKYDLALDDLATTGYRPFAILEAFRSGKASAGGYASREYDKVIGRALEASSWSQAMKRYRSAEAILLRETIAIPLFHGQTFLLKSRRVTGFSPNLFDLHPLVNLRVSR